tara:strand:- start:62 stop:229 length:168 start_codon:yes stop_codon:yes gene_type:complete
MADMVETFFLRLPIGANLLIEKKAEKAGLSKSQWIRSQLGVTESKKVPMVKKRKK